MRAKIELADWGKSMYGGYYANIWERDENESRLIYMDARTYRDLCNALSTRGLKAERTKMYRKVKDETDYCNPKATILREARNAFAGAINRTYMGDDM